MHGDRAERTRKNCTVNFKVSVAENGLPYLSAVY